MKIYNSTKEDIEEIFRLYRIATEYMKQRSPVYWPEFDRKMVENEIAENRQWKMITNGKIACVWATTFSDSQIWEGSENDKAIYIHRIATSPDFRGQNLVNEIIDWARKYSEENNIEYIRLDTMGENHKLIRLYENVGFIFLGMHALKDPTGLPDHYQNGEAALFEIRLNLPSFR